VRKRKKIDLLIPGLFWPAAIRGITGQGDRARNLERVLSRSKQSRFPGRDLTETLFQLFGIAPQPGQDLPAGAVIRFGMDGDDMDGIWAIATPVYLLADRDRLLLIRLAPKAIPSADAEQLVAQFNAHFIEDELSMSVMATNQWCLKLAKEPEITTSNIEAVSGRHIEEYLPKGKGAAYWRKILNETQMLFFQNELNQTDMASDKPMVNALWVSGVGSLPASPVVDYKAIYANHALARGLARLSNISYSDNPDSLEGVGQQEGDALVLMTDLHEAELNADFEGWQQALADTESKLEKLLQNIDLSHDELAIYSCQGQVYNSGKRSLVFDILKRNKSLSRLLEEFQAAGSKNNNQRFNSI
jgi:hypothetical protein